MPFDDYEKVREIFFGNFGRTYLVRRLVDKATLVMKELDFSPLDWLARQDALNEVSILCSLKHPYLVRYREKFMHDSCMCLLMDECDEGSLWSHIRLCSRQRAVIPEAQVLRWFTQTCLAVKYLHERSQPIMHRDIKTQNILLARRDSTCWGNTKLLVEFGPMHVLDAPGSVIQGQIGTHYCQAPEICSRLPYGTPSDVWGLGCVLYELCAAHMPWEAKDIPEHIENIMLAPLSVVSDMYSSEVAQITAELLDHNAALRPSAAEVLKMPLLQHEIRKMLDDKHKEEAKVPETRQARTYQEGANFRMPRTARSDSPHPSTHADARKVPDGKRRVGETCGLPAGGAMARDRFENAYASECADRVRGDHDRGVPRSSRSSSPHPSLQEIQKLLEVGREEIDILAEAHAYREALAKGLEERGCREDISTFARDAQPVRQRSRRVPVSARSASPSDENALDAYGIRERVVIKRSEGGGRHDEALISEFGVRPLGQHNSRVPHSARSASPNEAAKLVLMPKALQPQSRASSRGASPRQEVAMLVLGQNRAPSPAAEYSARRR